MTLFQLLLALAMLLGAIMSGRGPGDPAVDPGASVTIRNQAADSAATEAPPNALSVTATAEPEETKVKAVDKVLTNIHSVEIRVMESYPMQMSLEVRGEHPDGCDFPVQVSQARTDNAITVEVYREIPSDVFCPMILRPYADVIHLGGGFEFGSYTIRVNDHTQSIEL